MPRAAFALPRLIAVLALLALLGACRNEAPSLAGALEPARGRVVEPDGRSVDLDALLAAARDRPVSVSFAYVGCGGRTPRMAQIRAATAAAGGDVLHVVLNAVDEPTRYEALVRDLLGDEAARPDPRTLRVLFVRKGADWPQVPDATVEGVMSAMGLRYGTDRLIETVRGIGLFDDTGAFRGIRF